MGTISKTLAGGHKVKDILVNLGKSLWTKHRKKLIAFILGLLFAGVAALTDIPLSEIQDAARDAASSQPAVEQIAHPVLEEK